MVWDGLGRLVNVGTSRYTVITTYRNKTAIQEQKLLEIAKKLKRITRYPARNNIKRLYGELERKVNLIMEKAERKCRKYI